MTLAHLNLKMSNSDYDLGKKYFENTLNAFKVNDEDKKYLMDMFEGYRDPCLKGVGPRN